MDSSWSHTRLTNSPQQNNSLKINVFVSSSVVGFWYEHSQVSFTHFESSMCFSFTFVKNLHWKYSKLFSARDVAIVDQFHTTFKNTPLSINANLGWSLLWKDVLWHVGWKGEKYGFEAVFQLLFFITEFYIPRDKLYVLWAWLLCAKLINLMMCALISITVCAFTNLMGPTHKDISYPDLC